MYLDEKRIMKNYVKDFFYIKKEDIDFTKDFKLEIKGVKNISSFIMDNYESEA
jgi:hypothetical protein